MGAGGGKIQWDSDQFTNIRQINPGYDAGRTQKGQSKLKSKPPPEKTLRFFSWVYLPRALGLLLPHLELDVGVPAVLNCVYVSTSEGRELFLFLGGGTRMDRWMIIRVCTQRHRDTKSRNHAPSQCKYTYMKDETQSRTHAPVVVGLPLHPALEDLPRRAHVAQHLVCVDGWVNIICKAWRWMDLAWPPWPTDQSNGATTTSPLLLLTSSM